MYSARYDCYISNTVKYQRLNEIRVWIRNYNHAFLWDIITEVMARLSYYISLFCVDVITYQCSTFDTGLANVRQWKRLLCVFNMNKAHLWEVAYPLAITNHPFSVCLYYKISVIRRQLISSGHVPDVWALSIPHNITFYRMALNTAHANFIQAITSGVKLEHQSYIFKTVPLSVW